MIGVLMVMCGVPAECRGRHYIHAEARMENLMSHTPTETTIAATDGPRRTVENSPSVPTTTARPVSVDGRKVFYRQAGNPKSPVVLLLHGFPTSSHMFRELI